MPKKPAGAHLEVRRIILFAVDVPGLARWYEHILGIPIRQLDADGGWAQLGSGACEIALHGGGVKRQDDCGHKIVFVAEDVGKMRARLNARGAKFGAVKRFGELHLCDGPDLEGNILQLSNRL